MYSTGLCARRSFQVILMRFRRPSSSSSIVSQYARSSFMKDGSQARLQFSLPSSAQRLMSFDQNSVSSSVSQTCATACRANTMFIHSTSMFVSSHSRAGSRMSANFENEVGYMYMCTTRSIFSRAGTQEEAFPLTPNLLPERSSHTLSG